MVVCPVLYLCIFFSCDLNSSVHFRNWPGTETQSTWYINKYTFYWHIFNINYSDLHNYVVCNWNQSTKYVTIWQHRIFTTAHGTELSAIFTIIINLQQQQKSHQILANIIVINILFYNEEYTDKKMRIRKMQLVIAVWPTVWWSTDSTMKGLRGSCPSQFLRFRWGVSNIFGHPQLLECTGIQNVSKCIHTCSTI